MLGDAESNGEDDICEKVLETRFKTLFLFILLNMYKF